MATNVKVNTNGNYIAEVTIDGGPVNVVGPGSMIEKSWGLAHGSPHTITVTERDATPEEIAAAAPKPAPEAA